MSETLLDNNMDTTDGGLILVSEAKNALMESTKWARFLAIVGFIVAALLVILGLFAGKLLAQTLGAAGIGMGPAFFSVVYIIMALFYFFPCLFLLKFANKTKLAILSNNTQFMREGLSQLRFFFRFIGIVTVVILGLYLILIVKALLS